MSGRQSGSNPPDPFPARAVDQAVFVYSEKLVAGGAVPGHLVAGLQFALSARHTLYGAASHFGLILGINQRGKFVPIRNGLIGVAAFKAAA